MASSIAISLLVSFTLTPMLAARWLRLDPPDRRAPQEHPRAAGRRLLPARSSASTWRCSAFVDATAAGSSWLAVARDAGLAACRWSRRCPKGFLPKNDEAQFEVERAHARGDQPGRDPDRRRAHRARGARVARGAAPPWSPSATTSRRRPTWRDLRAPGAARPAQGHARTSCRTGSAARSCPSCPRSTGVSVVAGARRSAAAVQHGDRAVHPERPRPRPAHAVRRRDRREAEGGPGRGRRRHQPGDRQAGGGRARRPAQGRRPRRQRRRRRVRRRRSWSAASKVSRYEEAGREYDIRVRAAASGSAPAPRRSRQLTVPSHAAGRRAAGRRRRAEARPRARRRSTATRASARSRSWPTRRRASARARWAPRSRRSSRR